MGKSPHQVRSGDDTDQLAISQNGNAYQEGLSENWDPIQRYWREPTPATRDALRTLLTLDATKWQYLHGVPDASRVSPDGYTLDHALLSRPGNAEVQLDLFGDYAANVALYPQFQAYFRAHRPPLLAGCVLGLVFDAM